LLYDGNIDGENHSIYLNGFRKYFRFLIPAFSSIIYHIKATRLI